jgi:dephospho-CoA kinase
VRQDPTGAQWPDGLRVIGLTGGIASGKSTVSDELRRLGAEVIDADVLAREVVAPGTPGLLEVSARFPGVVGPDGRLDRQALGQRVFSSEEDRLALNALLHPRIQRAAVAQAHQAAARGAQVVIYDAPLLIENGLHLRMHGVIVVSAPEAAQVERLRRRNQLSEAEARARLQSQLPLAQKLRHARWVVDNSGSLADTLAQVGRIWESITRGSDYAAPR